MLYWISATQSARTPARCRHKHAKLNAWGKLALRIEYRISLHLGCHHSQAPRKVKVDCISG